MPVTPIGDSWTVTADVQISYAVEWAPGYFHDGDPRLILGDCPPGPRVVVIDQNVNDIYGEVIERFLRKHGVEPAIIPIAVTEATKTMETVLSLFDRIKPLGLNRRSAPIIAIGGGIVTDLVGFLASMLLRGVPWVRIVTTLQLVDAGPGIKTGGNRLGKSTFGAFHAPVYTIVIPDLLATLPTIHIRDTTAEIVKVAAMVSLPLFVKLERFGPQLVAEKYQGETTETAAAAHGVLRLAIQYGLEGNADNLREENLDRWLHFGHTWSGTLETAAVKSGAVLLHGHAVSIDMALSAVLAWRGGLITKPELHRLLRLLRSLELPTWHHNLTDSGLMQGATDGAIRTRDGLLRLPLMEGIGGHTFCSDIGHEEIAKAVEVLSTMQGAA